MGQTASYKDGNIEKSTVPILRDVYFTLCLGSGAGLTVAKWRIWDLPVGNLALLNVEFYKPRNYITHTHMFLPLCMLGT